jgi:ribosomal protein S18 acetylase RimI-like enzyme
VEPAIVEARLEDAGEILTLQRAAFVVEAQEAGDPCIPALLETLEEVRAAIAAPDVLLIAVRDRGRLIGTDRVRLHRRTATIGRLAVAPDRQGRGLGTAMLRHLEDAVRQRVDTLAIFTGSTSLANLRLYRREGYREVRRELRDGPWDTVHLEKAAEIRGGSAG